MSDDRLPDWTLHYEDGSTFSSDDGRPDDSPRFGAIFVLQPRVDGADLVGDGAKALIYRVDKGGWMPVFDDFGLMDQLTHYSRQIVCTRFGRQVWTPEYSRMAGEAARRMRGR